MKRKKKGQEPDLEGVYVCVCVCACVCVCVVKGIGEGQEMSLE